MDFESFLTFLLFLLFFVLPTIIKQLKARKAKKEGTPKKAKSTSFFGKIGEEIRRYLEDLERQAQEARESGARESEAREPATEEQDFWESMAEEDEEEPAYRETPPPLEEKPAPVSAVPYRYVSDPPPAKPAQKKRPKPQEEEKYIRFAAPSVSLSFRQDPLQNAIVLSEILSSPLALRKPEQDRFRS